MVKSSWIETKDYNIILFSDWHRQHTQCKWYDFYWSFWSALPLQHVDHDPTNHDPGDVLSRGKRKMKKRVLHFGRLNSQIVMQWMPIESSELNVAKSFAGRLWTVKHVKETVIYRLKVCLSQNCIHTQPVTHLYYIDPLVKFFLWLMRLLNFLLSLQTASWSSRQNRPSQISRQLPSTNHNPFAFKRRTLDVLAFVI